LADGSRTVAGSVFETRERESADGGLHAGTTARRDVMRSLWKRYGFFWVTLGFFLISLTGHWVFAWFAYVQEQAAHQQPIAYSAYFVQVMRETLENWQSEFLQLIWQVAGLALLLHVGSPQSKEGEDRIEAKIDAVLRHIDPLNAERTIAELDDAYAGRHTDARHAHL
jgi:hypothetical protein